MWGGPNSRYSLFDAQRNFEDHGHMYDLGQGIPAVEMPTQSRLDLMKYVDEIRTGARKPDQRAFQALIKADHDERDRA